MYIMLSVIIIIILQNKYWHEFNGIVRQGAPLYLVFMLLGTMQSMEERKGAQL
jgi:hypothetical protein